MGINFHLGLRTVVLRPNKCNLENTEMNVDAELGEGQRNPCPWDDITARIEKQGR